MKKILIMITILLMAGSLPAQEDSWSNPPDMERIKKEVTTKTNPRYYPKLVKRFAECDTTLVYDDIEALYYGQAYQESYSSLGHFGMEEIRNMMRNDTLTPDDVKKLVDLANDEIKRTPADPQPYYYKHIAQYYSVRNHGADTNDAIVSYSQFMAITNVIINTGDGKSMNHAMHVLNVSDEYFVMNMIGVQMTSQHLISKDGHFYDLFLLDTNNIGLDSLWFNIDVHFAHLNKVFSSNSESKKEKKVTSVDIPLNTWFDIEVVKVKKKKSQFLLRRTKDVDATVFVDSVMNDSVPKNHIQGYFCKARLSGNSDHENTCLIFKANIDETPLNFDTYIQYSDSDKFHTTSNSGILSGVKMDEIWNDRISAIRISNIRKDK